MAKSFRELVVWRKSMDLAESIYRLTEDFPKREVYGLSAQMRRCAVSIASNLAEGSARATRKDFRQFVLIARGSNFELQTQLELARRVGLADSPNAALCEAMTAEVARMLAGLSDYLAGKPTNN